MFKEAVNNHIGRFDGTRITLPNGNSFTIARNPDYEHSKRLFVRLKLAKEYDPTIEFSIPFCIAFSKNCNCGSKACLPLFGEQVTWSNPVPQEVDNFFKNLKLRPLSKNIESFRSQLQSVHSKIERLEDLLSSSVTGFDEISAEVEELKQDLANIQSKFHQADNHLTALRNLLEANKVASTLFAKDLAVISPDLYPLMEQSESKRKIYFDQMTSLTKHLCSREEMASGQKQAIHSHQRELEAQVVAENQLQNSLLKARMQLWSKLKELGPENIPSEFIHFFKAGSILSANLKKMLSAKKVAAQ
jgi:regulator of replication initiation timing